MWLCGLAHQWGVEQGCLSGGQEAKTGAGGGWASGTAIRLSLGNLYITQGLGWRDPGKASTYLNDSQLGQGSQGSHKCPGFQGSQQAKGTQTIPVEARGRKELFWACALPGTHSSNFPSRICSKEKGRNLKPAPE